MARPNRNEKKSFSIAIVGDGHTEKIYFDQLRKSERLKIDLKPELPSGGGGDYGSVLKKAEQLSEDGYDLVLCLIDMDKIIEENKLVAFGLKKEKLEKRGGFAVFECNPSFDLWFLLHFVYSTKPYVSCDDLLKDLKIHLPGYSKNTEHLKRANLYETLKDKLPTAKTNAAKLEDAQNSINGLRFPRCQVHLLIENLRKKN